MCHFDFDLRPYNSFKLPCQAQVFAEFSSLDELLPLLKKAKASGWPVRILGGGSNVLLARDLTGIVFKSADTQIEVIKETSDHCYVAVGAGVNWHQWVLQSIAYGHGLENLALIPGSVGAAPVQNIGAYGVEVSDYLDHLIGVKISTKEVLKLSAMDCQFGYRESIFKGALARDFIITTVVFKLSKTFAPNLSYGPLQKLLNPSPMELIEQVMATRQEKLPDPNLVPNAGSFFKNPVVSAAQAQQLKQTYPQLPIYPQGDQQVKLAAAWLIEQAGFKGQWHGNVRMHDQQALVLTTNGQASFDEIMQFKDLVVAKVQALFAIRLEAEPQVF